METKIYLGKLKAASYLPILSGDVLCLKIKIKVIYCLPDNNNEF